jgi:hypothetical protein
LRERDRGGELCRELTLRDLRRILSFAPASAGGRVLLCGRFAKEL